MKKQVGRRKLKKYIPEPKPTNNVGQFRNITIGTMYPCPKCGEEFYILIKHIGVWTSHTCTCEGKCRYKAILKGGDSSFSIQLRIIGGKLGKTTQKKIIKNTPQKKSQSKAKKKAPQKKIPKKKTRPIR
jgi:hypothetical protein